MIGDHRETDEPAAVLFPRVASELPAATEPRLLTGRSYDDHSVWQVTDHVALDEEIDAERSEIHDDSIGIYIPTSEQPALDAVPSSAYDIDFEALPAAVTGTHLLLTGEEDELTATVRGVEDPAEIVVEEVDLDRLMVRIEDGPTPLGELRDKKVAIIGVGSGGALVADYLAKSGVQDLVLIDDDLFETHNIVRHVCGMDALGRHKVDAVKSYLLNRLPDLNIEGIHSKFELGSQADIDRFKSILGDVDLIVSASAEHSTNNLVESFVYDHLETPIPVVYAGMFEDLNGGILIRVDPRSSDRCYHCIYSGTETGGRGNEGEEDSEQTAPRPSSPEADVPYDRSLEEEASQPGLGLDVDNLSVFTTKMCLYTLLRDTDHGLAEMEESVYIWGNRDMVRAPFDPHLPDSQVYGLELMYEPQERLPQRENCPYCG